LEVEMNKQRCDWVDPQHELYAKYHDEEWGVPCHDDRKLFEMLVLEGAQAGLSWSTVLKKRENYRNAFDNFDPAKVALYGEDKVAELLANEGIIRNRLKVYSAIRNAKVVLAIKDEFTSFDKYIWGFVGHKPIQSQITSMSDIPASTEVSDKISKDLKKRGMNFVGSTIIYAFMQAVGMVNDHQRSCFRHSEVGGLS
jgi:DNA-3-methyladenine glycosylase I